MNTEVLPHFHKLDKISEKDLVPNGQIYESLPESAQEGSRVIVESPADTFTVYYYLKGSWRKVGASGFTLKTYQTVNANSLTISDLDLDADGIYKIFVKARDGTASSGTACMRINGDSSSKYYVTENGATYNITGIFFALSYGGTAPTQYQFEILINKSPGVHPQIEYHGTSSTATATDYPNNHSGSANYNSTTNITSLTFLNSDGTTVNTWDVWIYKLETS